MGLRKKAQSKVGKAGKVSKASKKKAQAKSGGNGNGKGVGKKKAANGRGRKRKSIAEPFPMKLTGMLTLKYRALQAEVSEAQAIFKRARDKVENEQNKKVYQPLLILLERQAEAEMELKRRIDALARCQLDIGRKFGIPDAEMHEYVVDATTGVMLHDPPKEAVQNPAS